MPISPIRSESNVPAEVMASPGGGTPSVSQKRPMSKRGRDSQSPDAVSRKRAKVESISTPRTQPREKNNPKRPQKAQSHNSSFNQSGVIAASQLDFSITHAQLGDGEIELEASEGVVIASQDIDLLDSQPTVQLEALGELDEDMTTPEIVCSTGSEASPDVPEETDKMEMPEDAPPSTPNCSQANIIVDERSKDSVLETPAHGTVNLDTNQDAETFDDSIDLIVKAVHFTHEIAEKVDEAATSSAQVAAVSDNAPAPAAEPEAKSSSYCAVM